jgi:hypothetical protein
VKAQADLVSTFLVASNLVTETTIPIPLVDEAESVASVDNHSGDIAIIGIAGRFPGAPNPDELYTLLRNRREGLSVMPERTSKTALPYDGSIYIPKKGVLEGALEFRAKFWNLSEDEARFDSSLPSIHASSN